MKKQLLFIITTLSILVFSCTSKHEHAPATGTIKAGGYQVYYERTGHGDPLLLLHAGLQDHTMWEEQIKGLSEDFEIITFDLPYHGKTTGSDSALLGQEIVKILLDSLHLSKVSIAGLSMGASVTQDFIIAYPERVNKAILISSGVNGFEQENKVDSVSMAWYLHFNKALNEKDTPGAAVEFTKGWAEGVYRTKDSLQAPVSKYVYNKTLENIRLHKMGGWPMLKNDPRAMESIGSIKLPVLIIDGDKDLPYIIVTSQHLHKTIPGATRMQMKGVAHMLNMEEPEEVNGIIKNFLKK